MRAKSETLAKQNGSRKRAPTPAAGRMRLKDRRADILGKAAGFFSEYGLTAQTRALANACGVSQRLLYRYFPSKAALLDEVYRNTIIGPFKPEWFAWLSDRDHGIEERLNRFYRDYFASVLTRQWMRLFLYSSLADSDMAPAYIASTVKRLMEVIVAETAHEQGIRLRHPQAFVHEVGWTLHGAISHLAIRRHLYKTSRAVPENRVIAMHVRSFLGGFKGLVTARRPPGGNRRRG